MRTGACVDRPRPHQGIGATARDPSDGLSKIRVRKKITAIQSHGRDGFDDDCQGGMPWRLYQLREHGVGEEPGSDDVYGGQQQRRPGLGCVAAGQKPLCSQHAAPGAVEHNLLAQGKKIENFMNIPHVLGIEAV